MPNNREEKANGSRKVNIDIFPDGLPLGHRGLSLPTEYDYHQAMAQHAAAVSAGNSSLHPAMSQIPMMSTGLNLSMNSGNHSLGSGMQSNVSNTHHMSHVGGGKMKNKKLKVNKDGIPAPKRATTAYINFTQWYREDQKRNGRQIPKIGEFGKECACKWNNMTGEEKQPFLEVAARDRERYRKEMSIYKPARDVNKPKRPGTAFMLFMADLRKEMAGKEPEGGVAALAKLDNLVALHFKYDFWHRTATAGSDVVQSGCPILDDFFQHLWPYIGNNTANVVFQIVKRLWLIRIDQ
ncbi:HMG box domain-containing protein [Trichonephila clavipes]|nr:HMG box domain-containing protein [Trichonephila clavipes]